jgi:3-dehydroquinate synthase
MTSLQLSIPETVASTHISILPRINAESFEKMIQEKQYDQCIILTDASIRTIADRYSTMLSLPFYILEVPSGDASKSLQIIEKLTAQMLDVHASRSTLLLGIGGGMITDLAGFLGSIFMRGIDTILLPTTLLGMVDAAIGGKNGVNTHGVKNILGTIRLVENVIIDVSLLSSLPAHQFSQGIAEMIKIAMICDREFYHWIEQHQSAILSRDEAVLIDMLQRSIQAKMTVIQSDLHESSSRMFLNFGHTIGHAIEAISEYKLSHGEAISLGMILELEASNSPLLEGLKSLLESFFLPTLLPEYLNNRVEEMWSVMQSDKKTKGGNVRIAIPKTLGVGSIEILEKDVFFSLFL